MFNQVQTQKLQHKILPQHIALLNLLHLDSMALEQRIQDEMTENPCLEETGTMDDLAGDKFTKDTVQDFQNWEEYGYDDIPDYKTEYENYLPSDKMPDRQLVETVDFRTELKKQFRMTEDSVIKQELAGFLIDSLNENGFLTQDLETIAEEISFKNGSWIKAEELKGVLAAIKELDPLGAGSFDLKEYFLIQLGKMDDCKPGVKLASRLLNDHFQDLRSANMDRLRRELQVSEDLMKEVLQLLSTLKTRPVTTSINPMQVNNTVLPDFVITMEGEELQVSLARQRSASLRISQSWVEAVDNADQDKTIDKGARQYMRSKLSSAQWFIKAIQERETNMLKVMRAILKFQRDYFLLGDTMQLRPMVLKNIADMVGLDISTVSRITCNKYADTPFGMILLKDLFTEGLINNEGDSISNKVIRTVVEEVVNKEDKKNPYTDQQLADILSERGYRVARRTVAKYRDQLHIPVAQVRAFWVQ
jgi:RNA polymerase sigma-54 factor